MFEAQTPDYILPDEVVACPFCQRSVIEHLDILPAGKVRRSPEAPFVFASGCRCCGAIFVNPPPSAEQIASIYEEGGEWKEDDRKARVAEDRTWEGEPPADSHTGQIVRLAARRGLTTPYVLDFGCGSGNLLNRFKKMGWKTCGLDPVTGESITTHEVRETLPKKPTFDLIVAKHVIEHVHDPLALLRGFRKALKPNGALYLAAPCIDRAGESGMRDYCLNDRHHFTAYTHRSLKHMMRIAGLAPMRSLHLGCAHRFAIWARPALFPKLGQWIAKYSDPLRDARLSLSRTSDSPLRQQAARMQIGVAAKIARDRRKAAKRKRTEGTQFMALPKRQQEG